MKILINVIDTLNWMIDKYWILSKSLNLQSLTYHWYRHLKKIYGNFTNVTFFLHITNFSLQLRKLFEDQCQIWFHEQIANGTRWQLQKYEQNMFLALPLAQTVKPSHPHNVHPPTPTVFLTTITLPLQRLNV